MFKVNNKDTRVKLAFTCSKLTVQTLELGVKYVQI